MQENYKSPEEISGANRAFWEKLSPKLSASVESAEARRVQLTKLLAEAKGLLKEGKFEEAEAIFLKVLAESKVSGTRTMRATAACNIGWIYEQRSKLKNALVMHLKAKCLDALEKNEVGLLNHYYNLGKISLDLNRSKQGFQYLTEARELAIKLQRDDLLEKIEHLLREG